MQGLCDLVLTQHQQLLLLLSVQGLICCVLHLFLTGLGEVDWCRDSLDQWQPLWSGVSALGCICSEKRRLHQQQETLCAKVGPPLPSLCQQGLLRVQPFREGQWIFGGEEEEAYWLEPSTKVIWFNGRRLIFFFHKHMYSYFFKLFPFIVIYYYRQECLLCR